MLDLKKKLGQDQKKGSEPKPKQTRKRWRPDGELGARSFFVAIARAQLTGGPSQVGRCYPIWMDYSECIGKCVDPIQCAEKREDYFECLHHRKEVQLFASELACV